MVASSSLANRPKPGTSASIITYEEYHPFGTTSWWATDGGTEVSAKRYRYTGKERDDETGLGYHGARYYAAWLGRWERPDPIGLKGGINRWAYCRGNLPSKHDPSGMADEEPNRPPAPELDTPALPGSGGQAVYLDQHQAPPKQPNGPPVITGPLGRPTPGHSVPLFELPTSSPQAARKWLALDNASEAIAAAGLRTTPEMTDLLANAPMLDEDILERPFGLGTQAIVMAFTAPRALRGHLAADWGADIPSLPHQGFVTDRYPNLLVESVRLADASRSGNVQLNVSTAYGGGSTGFGAPPFTPAVAANDYLSRRLSGKQVYNVYDFMFGDQGQTQPEASFHLGRFGVTTRSLGHDAFSISVWDGMGALANTRWEAASFNAYIDRSAGVVTIFPSAEE